MDVENFIELVDQISEFARKNIEYDWSIIGDYKKVDMLSIKNGEINDSVKTSNYGLGLRIIAKDNEKLISLNNFENWKQKLSNEIIKFKGKRVDYFFEDHNKEIKFGDDVFQDYNKKELHEFAEIDSISKSKTNYISQVAYKPSLRIFQTSNSRVLQYFPRSVFVLNLISSKINDSNYGKDAVIGKLNDLKKEQVIDNTVKQMRELEVAKPIKSGRYDAITDGQLTGVFIHEALGHASESDLVWKNDSCLKDRLGEKLGNVNVYDSPIGIDGELEWGSYAYDDEGIKAQKTKIIDSGVLKTYLVSLKMYHKFAKNLGLKPTGNSRVESYSHFPLVRMSNTYIEKGEYSDDELIEEVRNGILIKGSRGGQVNTGRGNFQFSAIIGYVVKNGKIEYPVKGASLKGDTLETLKNIHAVGNKYEQFNAGTCGKDGQGVPVEGYNPRVLIKNALIGGI